MIGDPGVLSSQGVAVAYRTSGPTAGLPVVFIHGWAGSGRMWDALVSGLDDEFRCVALDLPGHGDSQKPGLEWYSIENFAAVVGDVCRHLGLRFPALVGHSMGGMIALALAAGEGPQPGQVVVINPVITGRFTSGGWLGTRAARPLAGVTRRAWPVFTRALRRAPSATGRAWPRTWRRISEDMARTSGEAAVGSLRGVLQFDLTTRLDRVRAPTLVILGERDRTVPNREGRLAAQRIPDSRLVTLAAGHHPHDEAAAECLDALRSFLAVVEAT